jgi:hypothetical protein
MAQADYSWDWQYHYCHVQQPDSGNVKQHTVSFLQVKCLNPSLLVPDGAMGTISKVSFSVPLEDFFGCSAEHAAEQTAGDFTRACLQPQSNTLLVYVCRHMHACLYTVSVVISVTFTQHTPYAVLLYYRRMCLSF